MAALPGLDGTTFFVDAVAAAHERFRG
jgi:hypothetical protein